MIIVVPAACFTQDLPDKPEPQSAYTLFKDAKPTIWNANSRNGKILFWGLAAAGVGATIFDGHQMIAGTKSHACREARIRGVKFPSTRRVYGRSLGWAGFAIVSGYLLKKLRLPVSPYIGSSMLFIKHIRGTESWYETACM